MSAAGSLIVFESLIPSPRIPVAAGLPDFLDGKKHGLMLLDFDAPDALRDAVPAHLSLFFNELGLPCGEVDDISVIDVSDCDDETLEEHISSNTAVVLYDFNRKMDSLVSPGSITYCDRGSFRNDIALEWKYTGDISVLDSRRAEAFSMATRASFELAFMRNIFGHVEAKDLSQLGERLYDRAREVFDAVLVGFAEFPMTREQVDEMMEYLLFLDDRKQLSPRPLSAGAQVIPPDDELIEYGKTLMDAGKLMRQAGDLWDSYSRTSGAGLVPIETFSHALRDFQKMPLTMSTRRAIADVIGVSSALDALAHGVPLQDLLA